MDHNQSNNKLVYDGPGNAPAIPTPIYRALIEHLYSLSRNGMTLGLGRIGRVLADLKHPELAFKTIHVAGSNGKGSTCAFIASILSAHGRRVGLFTSPHLISLTERVQFVEDTVSREISIDALTRAILEVRGVAPDFRGLTFFEVMTAAALCAMRDAEIDIAVIEAGLGARLDATGK